MTIVYITRHGETEWNKAMRFQGNKNSELTEKGLRGAGMLSERMEDIEIDCIAASPLKRAYQTAEIIKGDKNIDIVKYDGLKEINLGDFEGMTYKEIEVSHGEQLKNIEENPLGNCYPNGESMYEFYDRVVKTFDSIIEEYKGRKILIVAHGGVVKCIECYYRKKPIHKDWMGSVVSNCSLTCIEVDEKNNIKEIFYDDTEHLNKESAL